MNAAWADLLEQFSYYNTQVVFYGVSVLGASAGMIGAFAVLRRRALVGDAVAHAALPGVCLAFMLLGTRNLTAMLLGALLSGLLGMTIISALSRWTRIRQDAAIGAVLSVFPGFGFVLSRLIQNQDWGGEGGKAGIDSFIYGKTAGMVLGDAHWILAAAIACLVIVLLLYKEFKAIVFDPGFASALGWPVYRLDLLLMSLIAAAVVIGLPAVGVILMAALLILPSVSASFWTNRLSKLLVLSGVFGFAMGMIGVALSAIFSRLPAGPIIVLSGTGIFLVSLLVGTRRGLLARWFAQRTFERDLRERRFLQTAFEIVEARPRNAKTLRLDDFLKRRAWQPAFAKRELARAVRAGLLRKADDVYYTLTALGLKHAIEASRGQRLWQAYLTEYPELAAGVADLSAPSIEPFAPVAIVEALIEQLRAAGRWPDYAAHEATVHEVAAHEATVHGSARQAPREPPR